MTDTWISALCPGCFAAPGRVHPCPHCSYDEHAGRASFLLPHRALLHDQYLVGRVLGRPGGFGITYLGWDLSLETRVAIKEYLPPQWAGRAPGAIAVTPHAKEEGALFRYGLDRFLTEARTLARIDHPNVVRVRAYFAANGTAYLVMDYYPGCTLAEYLERRGGRLPETEALRLIRPILDGLRAVHAQGFLHRDIKPQNLYLANTGAAARPLLIDFGAARESVGERTRTVIYSGGYSPIEQYDEKGRQGPWTDIYSIAAVLYSLVTGHTLPDSTARVSGASLRPAADFGASPALSATLTAALAIRPEDRPQSVESFAARLGPTAQPASPVSSAPRATRTRWYWAAAAAPIFALGSLGVWRLIESRVHQGVDDRQYAAARAVDTEAAYSGYLAACATDACGHRPEAAEQLATKVSERRRQADLDAWAAAAKTDTPDSYRAYLAGCAPDGCGHRAEAQERLAAKAAERSRQADLDAYATAAKMDTSDAYRAYLAGCAAIQCVKRAEAQAGLDRTLASEHAAVEARAKAAAVPRTQPRQGPVGSIADEMVYVPGGIFEMGCSPADSKCWDEEKPAHQVTIPPFYIGRYEVTEGQWRAVMGDQANPSHVKGDDRAVDNVSWDDIQEFLKRLNARSGGKPYRLPTEAEWEYAARAGSKTPYWWGTAIGTGKANCEGCGSRWDNKQTAPVGSFPPNAFGLYDTVGNVYEHVQDCWHEDYSAAPVDGSEWGPCAGVHVVTLRGGCWTDRPRVARVSFRFGNMPYERSDFHGLRLAQDL